MNKYERYAFRQLILNTLIPPNRNNTNIFGNQFLYYLLGMHLFCKDVPEKTSSPIEKIDLTEEKEKLKEKWQEQKDKMYEAYNKSYGKWSKDMVKYMNTESNNPLVRLDKMFNNFIAGCIIFVCHLLRIKLNH